MNDWDNILMFNSESSIREMSKRDYSRYLEIKADINNKERKKMYDDLLKLIPYEEQILKAYFYPSLADKKNDKFGYLSKDTVFISNEKEHKMRSCGKTFIRSTENKVFKNEDIKIVIMP